MNEGDCDADGLKTLWKITDKQPLKKPILWKAWVLDWREKTDGSLTLQKPDSDQDGAQWTGTENELTVDPISGNGPTRAIH